MIVEQEVTQVLTNNKDVSSFGMEMNSMSYKVLSSTLYQDKKQAILREVSCNAYDSHIEAGIGHIPIRVKLPTTFDNTLEIEDFGLGLSDDEVRGELKPVYKADEEGQFILDENGERTQVGTVRKGGVYNTYFASTKRESNDVIGSKGLGSKSPLSYVNTFHVRARKDGIENWYDVFINGEGTPGIALTMTRETPYNNGLLVTIPVKPEDCSGFKVAAGKVFAFFDVKPDINLDLDELYPITSDQLEKLREDRILKVADERNKIFAVMGAVCYETNIHIPEYGSNNTKHLTDREYSILKYILKGNSVYIDFAMGDLDVGAGRENLSVDERTETNLYAGIKRFITDYSNYVQNKIDSFSNPIEAYLWMRNEFTVFDLAHFFTMSGHDNVESVAMMRISAFDGLDTEMRYRHRTIYSGVKNKITHVGNKGTFVREIADNFGFDRTTNPSIPVVYIPEGSKIRAVVKTAKNTLMYNPFGITAMFLVREDLSKDQQEKINKELFGYAKFYTIDEVADELDPLLPYYEKVSRVGTTERMTNRKRQFKVKSLKRAGVGIGRQMLYDLDDPNNIVRPDNSALVRYSGRHTIMIGSYELDTEILRHNKRVFNLLSVDNLVLANRQNERKLQRLGFEFIDPDKHLRSDIKELAEKVAKGYQLPNHDSIKGNVCMASVLNLNPNVYDLVKSDPSIRERLHVIGQCVKNHVKFTHFVINIMSDNLYPAARSAVRENVSIVKGIYHAGGTPSLYMKSKEEIGDIIFEKYPLLGCIDTTNLCDKAEADLKAYINSKNEEINNNLEGNTDNE